MRFGLALVCFHMLLAVSPGFSETASLPSQTKDELRQQQTALEQKLQAFTEALNNVRAKLNALEKPTGNSPGIEEKQTVLKQKEVTVLDEISVVSTRLEQLPRGVTRSTVTRSKMDNQPTKDFRESLDTQPGITLRKRNGPRDYSISIRGSVRSRVRCKKN